MYALLLAAFFPSKLSVFCFFCLPLKIILSLNVLISLISGKSFPLCPGCRCFFTVYKARVNTAKEKILKSLFKHSWILWIVLSLICIPMNIAALAVSALLQSGRRTEWWHKIFQLQQFRGKEMESMSNTELCLSLRSDRFTYIRVWWDILLWERTFSDFLF